MGCGFSLVLASLVSQALTQIVGWETTYAYHTDGGPACPPSLAGGYFYADPQKRACCPAPDGMEVLMATGADNKATPACCLVSSTCTGAVPTLVDWTPFSTVTSDATITDEATISSKATTSSPTSPLTPVTTNAGSTMKTQGVVYLWDLLMLLLWYGSRRV